MTANYLNTVSDDLDSLCRAVLEALKTNDVVITTGGVSAGDFDYMPEVIRRIGGRPSLPPVKNSNRAVQCI